MTKQEFLKIALRAIDDEAELLGDPPKGFIEGLIEDNDPELLTLAFRTLVKQTKESIAKRLKDRLNVQDTWLN